MAQMALGGRSGLAAVTLDDKYRLEKGRVYLTGTQALVRLPMVQRQRDAASGLNTGCFITGYRGSPLGALDQALWGAKRFVERNHIRFQPVVLRSLLGRRLLPPWRHTREMRWSGSHLRSPVEFPNQGPDLASPFEARRSAGS